MFAFVSEYNGIINVLHFACNQDFVHVHHTYVIVYK